MICNLANIKIIGLGNFVMSEEVIVLDVQILNLIIDLEIIGYELSHYLLLTILQHIVVAIIECRNQLFIMYEEGICTVLSPQTRSDTFKVVSVFRPDVHQNYIHSGTLIMEPMLFMSGRTILLD